MRHLVWCVNDTFYKSFWNTGCSLKKTKCRIYIIGKMTNWVPMFNLILSLFVIPDNHNSFKTMVAHSNLLKFISTAFMVCHKWKGHFTHVLCLGDILIYVVNIGLDKIYFWLSQLIFYLYQFSYQIFFFALSSKVWEGTFTKDFFIFKFDCFALVH